MPSPAVRIVRLLRARGIETTEAPVQQWLDRTRQFFEKHYQQSPPDDVLAAQLEKGHKSLTMCLHLVFGDALDDSTLPPIESEYE